MPFHAEYPPPPVRVFQAPIPPEFTLGQPPLQLSVHSCGVFSFSRGSKSFSQEILGTWSSTKKENIFLGATHANSAQWYKSSIEEAMVFKGRHMHSGKIYDTPGLLYNTMIFYQRIASIDNLSFTILYLQK